MIPYEFQFCLEPVCSMFKQIWVQPADLYGGTTYSEIRISTSVLENCHVLHQNTSDIIKRSVAR